MNKYIHGLLTLFLLSVGPAQAGFPSTIPYQGRLVSGTNLVNAIVAMHFRLYGSDVGGDLLFESTNTVLVVDGLYATAIGEHTILGDLEEALNNYPVYLEIDVNGDTLSPRERFKAVPYALKVAAPSQGQNVSIIDTNGVETFYPSLTNAFEALDSRHTLRLYPGDHYVEVIPPGNSSINREENAGLVIANKHDIRIEGVGYPRIYSDAYGDYLYIRDSFNIDIEGVTFDGLGPSDGIDSYFAMIHFAGTNQHIRISDCRFLNFGNHGISHLHGDKQTVHAHIRGCFFENGGQTSHPFLHDDGAAISGIGSYWTITENHFNNVLRGIEIEGPGPSPQRQIIIANNTLRDIWGAAIMLFASSGISANYTDIAIHDNVMSGKYPRPEEVVFAGGGIGITGGKRISIRGNIISNFRYAYGAIQLNSYGADIRDCIISKNRIHVTNTRGIQLSQRSFGALADCLVTANVVTECGDRGIIISGTGHSVVNNVTTRNTGQTGAGIHIFTEEGATEDIFLTGNNSRANKHGVLIDEDVGHVEMGTNFLLDNSTGDLTDLR